ncbi:MAG: response regulator transcription factor [Desulfobacterales bacterium]|nr:response regulator transcription factor [Desulfobacterales bacterium]
MSKTIKILICDDHAIVRIGLSFLIGANHDMELVGEAVDGEEAVAMAKKLKPDVIIMDLVMPRKDGVTAISEIKKNNQDARILVLTSFSDDKNVFSAIKAGASGYLLKDSSPEDLLQGINDVYQGKSPLHPVIAQKVIQEMHKPTDLPPTDDPLSAREVEVLQNVAQGMSNQEIARTLKIKEGTVRIHVGNILNKLQLSNRTQAALYALREGLAELNVK